MRQKKDYLMFIDNTALSTERKADYQKPETLKKLNFCLLRKY